LFSPILLILVLGGLAMLHVVALARLSELEWEQQRLQRLSLTQTMRHGEAMRERNRRCSHAVLSEFANREGMVPPPPAERLYVGNLPPEKRHWNLPGDSDPTSHAGQLLVGVDAAAIGADAAAIGADAAAIGADATVADVDAQGLGHTNYAAAQPTGSQM